MVTPLSITDAGAGRTSVLRTQGGGTGRALRPPGDGATVRTQRALSDEQERIRIEGLRALARIIARRALADSRPPAGPTPRMRTDGTQRERIRPDRSA